MGVGCILSCWFLFLSSEHSAGLPSASPSAQRKGQSLERGGAGTFPSFLLLLGTARQLLQQGWDKLEIKGGCSDPPGNTCWGCRG